MRTFTYHAGIIDASASCFFEGSEVGSGNSSWEDSEVLHGLGAEFVVDFEMHEGHARASILKEQVNIADRR